MAFMKSRFQVIKPTRFVVQMHPPLWLVRRCDFLELRVDFQSLGGRLNHVIREKSSTNQNPYTPIPTDAHTDHAPQISGRHKPTDHLCSAKEDAEILRAPLPTIY